MSNALRLRRILAACVLLAALPAPAMACSPGYIPKPEELVDAADGIYRARADGLAAAIIRDRDGFSMLPASRIHFTVPATLKGAPLSTMNVPGEIVAERDPNDHPPPYEFVRPGGRHGNCFALGYVEGRQYLLFLRDGDAYWAALAPTNEEVGGVMDPWVVWVQQRLRSSPAAATADPACVRFDVTLLHCPIVPVTPAGLADREYSWLEFTVRRDGSVADVRVMLHRQGQRGTRELPAGDTRAWAEPAVRAVSQWRYRASGREGSRQVSLHLFAAPKEEMP